MAYEITLLFVSPLITFLRAFIGAGTCLPSRCLATVVFSSSTIPAFRRHVMLHSKPAGRGVFYAVGAVTNNQHVVRGK
jgi:hypothetical protein